MTGAPGPAVTGRFLPWARVECALSLLAVDPQGLGGLWLRARAGALRDRALGGLAAIALPLRRIHPATPDAALFGGLDLAASLGAGRAVAAAGLLAEGPALVLAMAERASPGMAARLAQWLDRGTGTGGGGGCLIALDEGAGPDEGLAPALADRMGLFLDLDGLAWSESRAIPADHRGRIPAARERLPFVEMPGDAAEAAVQAALALGIGSLRAPALVLAAARAAAALRGALRVGADDLALAAGLVLAHRAALPPEDGSDEAPPPPPPEPGDAESEARRAEPEAPVPADLLVEAARAALPADVLSRLAAGRAARGAAAAGASGSGVARRGNRRGRPLPPRAGRPSGEARIDPVATLRAAAPWQALRRRATPDRTGLLIRAEDLHLRRFEETSDRVLIFAVDASGSSAVARLAEAKGAVELLLARAYARRDHVALVAFRGTGADLLLPPTRSLVAAKRRLAALPGGGGTPLAAGLRLAAEVARGAVRRGMTPTLALLTDGRANVALDGRGNRALAAEEALRMARLVAAGGIPALVLDTATRPQEDLPELARAMGARYLALPRARALALSEALSAALGP